MHGCFPVPNLEILEALDKKLEGKEVKQVLDDMGAYKTPRPDDYRSCFFQKN